MQEFPRRDGLDFQETRALVPFGQYQVPAKIASPGHQGGKRHAHLEDDACSFWQEQDVAVRLPGHVESFVEAARLEWFSLKAGFETYVGAEFLPVLVIERKRLRSRVALGELMALID